jgi:mono/diheme cytochrome c family protein
MNRGAVLRLLHMLLLVLAAQAAPGESAADDTLDETQKLGRRLYGNHCVVCHEKPQVTSIQFGPALSRDSVVGREGIMRDVISNGTPRMPGFKYQFDAAQIDAIVAFLETLPAAPPPRSGPTGGGPR